MAMLSGRYRKRSRKTVIQLAEQAEGGRCCEVSLPSIQLHGFQRPGSGVKLIADAWLRGPWITEAL